mmetsp:Transcript_55600/g.178378  ORF Transcript_55600/g.178378 Transcript_55600/m.178378 type:complete len:243 (-) Transcript_55600:84-812(-)
MPLSTVQPTLHKGPLHVGPAVALALRGPRDRLEGGARRPRWDDRHHVTWKNDYQNTNMRSYFDRFVDRVDIPVCPRPQLRPTWSIDVAEQPDGQVHRVFDPVNATFRDQWQWAMEHGAAAPKEEEGQPGITRLPRSTSQCTPKKPRSPRRTSDLKEQRLREAEWDKQHSVVYSRFNLKYQQNVRSYFDRWKDDEGGGRNAREPTWRLSPERRSPLDRSRSAPILARSVLGQPLPGRPQWVGP